MKNGLFEENGELIYYKDDSPYHAGVIKENGDIYYIGWEGRAVKGQHTVHRSMANGILTHGIYEFGDDYKLIEYDADKNGLFEENGEFIYYLNGRPYHAGVIKDGKDIYYIGSNGRAVKGTHYIHQEMTHDILKRGTYTIGDDYKVNLRSYVRPKGKNHSKSTKAMSWNKKAVILSIALVTVIAAIYTYGIFSHLDNKKDDGTVIPSERDILLPYFGNDKVLLCTESAKSVYEGDASVMHAISNSDPYRAFEFGYQLADRDGMLTLSEYADMRDAKMYVLPYIIKSISIDNLKTGTTYYYIFSVDGKTYPGSFTTAESTRFVKMPGVKNTRDIGGYTTLDGKKVKQGMLIRGTEIDGLVESSYFLERNAVESVKDTFGFVYDFDLRSPTVANDVYQSRLGKDVTHKFYDSPMYGSIFSADYQPALKQIFTDLANPANYPMYLHCTYGADRTGTICFLLEGILNLPEEVMRMDYQLTGVINSEHALSTSINTICGGVEGYAGDTLQEKIVSYLTSPAVGVTMKQIESIRDIFLED